MTRTTTVARSLADDLRGRTDGELADLLRARPDLVVPVPVDIAQLASRAATRVSAVRALDRLDQFTLLVVDALLILPDPTTATAVRGLTGSTQKAVREALDTLRHSAVIWNEGQKIHLVRVVREIVGPHPSGLGPPARQLMAGLPPSRLTAIAADLGLAAAVGHAETADAVASHIGDPESLVNLLDWVGPDAVSALRVLAEGPPTGRVDGAWREVDRDGARTPVDRLLAAALLVPVDENSVVLPREVGLHLRGGRLSRNASPTPPAPATVERDSDRVDRAAAAGAFEIIRKIETVLDAWAQEPPPVLRTGGLGVRDLRRLPALLDSDEADAAFVVELAYVAGLLAPSTDENQTWVPTPEYDAWQRETVASRWLALARSWRLTSRVAGLVGTRDDRDRPVPALSGEIDRPVAPEIRDQVLQVMAEVPPGFAPDRDAVVEVIRWKRPRRGGRLRDDLVAWTVREAEALGVTGMGALASYGRDLLGAGRDERVGEAVVAALTGLLPEPLEHILLQADLTAVAPGPLRSDLARELNLLSDVESRGGASVHRFTAASVRRGLDAGRAAAEIHEFLLSVSRTPVPQPLTYLVDDVARRHGRLRVGAAGSFVRSDDQTVLSEILASAQAPAMGLRRIAPTVLVSSLDGVTLIDRLRQSGFTPTAENADGTVAVARAEPRRSLGRAAPPPALADRPAPTEAVLAAAVRALRAGDRSAAARPANAVPGRLGRSGSAQTLATLRDALEAGSTVWIGYVDQHGSTSERVVDPVRLEGGWLAAFDHRSSEVRSFAVHRISGVAPANG